MEVGTKIRTLRTQKGYTQEAVADMLGIQQSTYSNLENNKGKLDLNLIEKVATIFEVDIFDLFKEEGFTFYNHKNKGGNYGFVINQLSEKLIEQYELRIQEKDKEINELKNIINDLKK